MTQALEALEKSVSTCFDRYAHEEVMSRPEHFINQTITALHLAIEQAEKQEPVAWWREDGSICTDERQAGDHDIPLYTHRRLIPRDYTAPPQRQPLTEEEMELLWSTTNRHEHFFGQHLDFARAIERKHGIGGGE